MVFRGKPSKACQRCRGRKLRCDLRPQSCSSCIRAGAQCSGYRDISTLRISDQTEKARALSVKARSQYVVAKASLNALPKTLPLDIEVQARNLFFTTYITDFSRTWSFLLPYTSSHLTPSYLSLSIDAVSLALLSHHLQSSNALALSRQKYVSALRKTNTALQDTTTAMKKSTLNAALLLDLFEKIDTRSIVAQTGGVDSHRAHVNGALALVQLRGLSNFTDESSLNTLSRLIMNCTISCVSREETVPEGIREVRRHMSRFVDVMDAKWRLGDLTIEATDLIAKTRDHTLSSQERERKCMELDTKFALLAEDSLYCKRVFVQEDMRSDRYLDGWYDLYPDQTATQMWNVLRLSRIILCEGIVKTYQFRKDKESTIEISALTTIHQMTHDICASVPQMTDCSFAALYKTRLGTGGGNSHEHTPNHYLDVYILIFGLYVAAWAENCRPKAREWIERQLEYMAEHFGIREAKEVREVLRRGYGAVGVSPWDVYRLLGSYAFAS